MQEYERKQLLERIDREGATVGASIPETIDMEGEPFELRAFVFETRKQDSIPPDLRDRVERVRKTLRRERQKRADRVESASISFEEGETLVESIVGLDRAIEALADLESADIEGDKQVSRTADSKRWMSFLQRALGHDTDRGRGGGR